MGSVCLPLQYENEVPIYLCEWQTYLHEQRIPGVVFEVLTIDTRE
jgi:hypothetical protein